MASTVKPGVLTVQSAYPDPPFELVEGGSTTGFDIQLMRAVCRRMGLALETVAFQGADFNRIFDALAERRCDAVISGTTITAPRAELALFSRPYLQFDQGVAVDRQRTPGIAATSDLRGLTAGIQEGNTSDLVARRLLAAGEIADIRYYPYDRIGTALDDLEAGRIGLVIKLAPVLGWLIKDRPALALALQVPTREKLGIAFARDHGDLCSTVEAAIDGLRVTGAFAQLQARWLGGSGAVGP